MTSKYMRILLNINLQFLSAEENGLINSWIFFLAGDRRPPATLLDFFSCGGPASSGYTFGEIVYTIATYTE